MDRIAALQADLEQRGLGVEVWKPDRWYRVELWFTEGGVTYAVGFAGSRRQVESFMMAVLLAYEAGLSAAESAAAAQ